MFDYAIADLALAVAHHILIFTIAGIITFEIGIVRSDLNAAAIARLARIDAMYGLCAVAVLAAGFTRAVYAAKGWDYYAANPYFWAKIAAFALVGVLSIVPTVAIVRWRRASKANAAFMPTPDDIAGVARFLRLEAGAFVLIPVFAAVMARG